MISKAENLILFSQCSAVRERGSVEWRAEMMFYSKVLAAPQCKTLLLRYSQVTLSARLIMKTILESRL